MYFHAKACRPRCAVMVYICPWPSDSHLHWKILFSNANVKTRPVCNISFADSRVSLCWQWLCLGRDKSWDMGMLLNVGIGQAYCRAAEWAWSVVWACVCVFVWALRAKSAFCSVYLISLQCKGCRSVAMLLGLGFCNSAPSPIFFFFWHTLWSVSPYFLLLFVNEKIDNSNHVILYTM